MEKIYFKDFIIRNIKKIIITAIILILIAVIAILIWNNKQKGTESTIFSINKIILYNNANINNNSSNQSLENLSICQYTDLSIYLNNSLENSTLTDDNTIKKLYIDNISIDSKSDIGTKILNYKNPLQLGKYLNITNPENNKIDFNIVTTNSKNNNSNYDTPTFYTDCSNPITLGYLNDGIIQNYSISNNNNKVSYNAKIFKEANISIEDLNNTLNFTIHIVTNSNKKFSCNVSVNLSLDNDFLNNGYSFMSLPIEDGQYKFYRE